MLFWRGRFGLAAFSDYARADLVTGEGRAQFLIQPIHDCTRRADSKP
jgi:hypothetical protein